MNPFVDMPIAFIDIIIFSSSVLMIKKVHL